MFTRIARAVSIATLASFVFVSGLRLSGEAQVSATAPAQGNGSDANANLVQTLQEQQQDLRRQIERADRRNAQQLRALRDAQSETNKQLAAARQAQQKAFARQEKAESIRSKQLADWQAKQTSNRKEIVWLFGSIAVALLFLGAIAVWFCRWFKRCFVDIDEFLNGSNDTLSPKLPINATVAELDAHETLTGMSAFPYNYKFSKSGQEVMGRVERDPGTGRWVYRFGQHHTVNRDDLPSIARKSIAEENLPKAQ